MERRDAIEAFLPEADAGLALDELLAERRATVIPNLRRFPCIGWRFMAHPPQSAEALVHLAAPPAGAPDALREFQHGAYLTLYAAMEADANMYQLSIRRHRQLLSHFARLWAYGLRAVTLQGLLAMTHSTRCNQKKRGNSRPDPVSPRNAFYLR